MTVPPEVLDDQDRALLDRLAARVVELKLEVPAILTLESSRPLTVVAGQAMLFLEPIVQALQEIGFDGPTTLEVAGEQAVKCSAERLQAWSQAEVCA